MTATLKKRIVIAIALLAMLFAALGVLSACNGNNDEYKVTFMVQNDSGVWGEYATADSVDGSVELPTPTKDFYRFTNWYENQDFSGNTFTGKNVKENKTVYAKFVPLEVDIVFNNNSEGTKNLIDVANSTYVPTPGEGLEFSGWYTNSNFAEEAKWNGTSVVQTLYAKSVARITFNDGYNSSVYTTTVNPGTTFADPSTTTVEAENILQNYMSKHDISYWTADGSEEFDFSKPVTQNTEILVKWRSPFLTYEVNEATGNLIMTLGNGKDKYDDTDTTAKINTVPIISVLSEITYDKDNNGNTETYKVEGIRLEASMLQSSLLEKVIIGDGIVSIQGLVDNASSVKEIVLPSSLKVIQNCFNNLNNLTKIEVPDGVEVIIGSFWAETPTSRNGYGQYNYGNTYDFDIAIPESVKNLSMIPSNLTFTHTKDNAQNGDFFKDGNYIYQKDNRSGHEGDLVLIADFTDDTSVNVPEGVKGIQVGTYFNRSLNYVVLPSTFSYVRYNENLADYPSCKSQYSTKSMLWDSQYASNLIGNVPPTAYSIFDGMDVVTYVNFNATEYPTGLSAYAFIGDTTGYASNNEDHYAPCDSQTYSGKIIYTAESNTPQVNVTITDSFTGNTFSTSISKNKGEAVTVKEILAAIDTAATDKGETSALEQTYNDGKLSVTAKNFGINYDFSTILTKNVYLEVFVVYTINGGYVATANGDGVTATITGFNKDTAYAVTGGFIVGIPEKVTLGGKEYTVTAIGDNAFAGEAEIVGVILPASIKTIGEKAFFNAVSLVNIDMSSCKLESIGKSAFEDTSLTTISFSIASLKSVGAYAFKIETLKKFVPIADEENRVLLKVADIGDPVENEFYWSSDFTALYKYVSLNYVGDYCVYDVQYVACACGFDEKNYSGMYSMLQVGEVDSSLGIAIRCEVMEGALCYLKNIKFFEIVCVSKFNRNCLNVELGSLYDKIAYEYNDFNDGNKIMNMDSSIFEAGWCNGILSTDSDYATLQDIMRFAFDM